MKLLLDTHAFIWFDSSPSEVGLAAVAACRDPGNELIVSVASVWEIQIKLWLGKLKLHRPLRELLDDQVRDNRLQVLPVHLEHVLRLES